MQMKAGIGMLCPFCGIKSDIFLMKMVGLICVPVSH